MGKKLTKTEISKLAISNPNDGFDQCCKCQGIEVQGSMIQLDENSSDFDLICDECIEIKVHQRHCSKNACKYGDQDCPTAKKDANSDMAEYCSMETAKYIEDIYEKNIFDGDGEPILSDEHAEEVSDEFGAVPPLSVIVWKEDDIESPFIKSNILYSMKEVVSLKEKLKKQFPNNEVTYEPIMCDCDIPLDDPKNVKIKTQEPQPRIWKVEVMRTATAFRTIEVIATTEQEACDNAIDAAGGEEFGSGEAEYSAPNGAL